MTEPHSHHQHHLGAIDEFESMFKRAERAPFRYEEVPLPSIAVVTDGTAAEAETLIGELRAYLPRIDDRTTWHTIPGDAYGNVNQLLDRVRDLDPSLIVTSRCLDERELVPQHTLGVYVDVLTQVTTTPVLLLPGTAPEPHPLPSEPCREVMVVTDHISGDDRLINHGARFTSPDGTLWLVHIEDDVALAKYSKAIGRIPEIHSDETRRIADQLLADADNFVETCRAELAEANAGFRVEKLVEFGHRIVRYRELAARQRVDLIVTNTKDEDQLAMHGLAYALSVELTEVPQLLL